MNGKDLQLLMPPLYKSDVLFTRQTEYNLMLVTADRELHGFHGGAHK